MIRRKPITKKEVLSRVKGLHTKKIKHVFNIRVLDQSDMIYKEKREVVRQIHLICGQLFIDGKKITNPFFGQTFVSFIQQTDAEYLAGVLNLFADGRSFAGHIYKGASKATATVNYVCGTVPPSVYSLKIAKNGATPPTKSSTFPDWCPPVPTGAGDWEESINISMGFEFNEGSLPTSIYTINGQDATGEFTTEIDNKNDNLILNLIFSDRDYPDARDYYGSTLPPYMKIEFDWQGNVTGGVMKKFDNAANKTNDMQYAASGTLQHAESYAAMLATVSVNAVVSSPMATSDSTLNITELHNFNPDPQELQDNQFNMLVENMKWAVGEDPATKSWLSDFFGLSTQPLIGDDRKKLIKQALSFYTDRFAVVYLGSPLNNMTGEGAPAQKLSDTENKNMQFYMQAGLAAEEGYNTQTQGIFVQSFVETVPRLQLYIQDQQLTKILADGKPDPNDDHNWAQKLYNELTTPAALNQTMQPLINGSGIESANRQSTILTALQPTGELATYYHQIITTGAIHQALFELNMDDPNVVAPWLEDSINAFIKAFLDGSVKLDDPAMQAQAQAIAIALQEASDAAGNTAELAAAMADIICATSEANFWDKLATSQTKLGSFGSKVANSLYFIVFLGGISSAILAFTQWNNLSKEKRAEVVLSCVNVVARAVNGIPEIFNIGKLAYTKTKAFRDNLVNLATNEETVNIINTKVEDGFKRGAEGLNEMTGAVDENGIMKIEGTSWQKSFKGSVGKICNFIGVAVSVAFALISEFEFLKALTDGAPLSKTILDGIIMVANFGVAICAISGLFFASQAIPIVGAVFAIVGVIAGLILKFLPPKKKKSPADKFMDDTLMPAVSGDNRWILDAPTDWDPDKPVPQTNIYTVQPI